MFNYKRGIFVSYLFQMKHLLISVFIVLIALQSNGQNAKVKATASKPTIQKAPPVIHDKAEIKFDTLEHNFGDVLEGQDAIYVFKFYNIGKEPLIISEARPGCSCTVSDYTKEPIMPGKSGSITVKYGTQNRMGAFTKAVTVSSNSTLSPVVSLTITGTVIAAPQETR